MSKKFKDYYRVLLAFSGGKDSLACLLTLLQQGCPPEKSSGATQFASGATLLPLRFKKLVDYEDEFGYTLKRDVSLETLVESAETYPMQQHYIEAALNTIWTLPLIVEQWELPQGAYSKETCGAS